MTRAAHDLVVIGGGPAGLAAAAAAREAGCADLLVVERDRALGGILNQCIHDGFGLHRFGEALSGPEYAARCAARVRELRIPVLCDTMALALTAERELLLSSAGALRTVTARAVVLATGCRERARGALSIPGTRPAGVYTAGAAQCFVNMENIMPGRRVAILGSGDIGLIMARRMTLEGAKVEGVFELLPYSSGLPRNIQQCLADYGIPLHLSTTVVETVGARRLEGVRVASVGPDRTPIAGTERLVPCDTLLLSVGLIPENELAREAGAEIHPVTGGPVVDERCMTSVPGIFSCGNALHVHDLVDWVSGEAARAGANAAAFARGDARGGAAGAKISVSPGPGVRYVAPQKISCQFESEIEGLKGEALNRFETKSLKGEALNQSETAGPKGEALEQHHVRPPLVDSSAFDRGLAPVPGTEAGVSLAFRVESPSRDGVVEVAADGRVVRSERRARLHPAEMIWVELERSALRGCRALEVRVRS